MSEKHILVFNPYAGGHHGSYVRMLVENWVSKGRPGTIRLVLNPDFSRIFPDITDYVQAQQDDGVAWSPYSEKTDFSSKSTFGFIQRDISQGKILKQILEHYKPTHCLLMYFDHLQASLAINLRFNFPIKLSGIYFRPSFHYTSLGSPPYSAADRIRRIQKRVLLFGALTNPHLVSVLSLDPYAVPFINRWNKNKKGLVLPDGIVAYRDSSENDPLRLATSKTDNRRTALLFGGLTRRKGILRVLEALPLLPKTTQTRMRLVLAGPVAPGERTEIYQKLEQVRSTTDVEVLLDDRYVPDETLQSYIDEADFMLVTYQQHIGSSGVLIRAAEAGVPVLGSDFGLVGAHINRNALGLAVDATSAESVSKGIRRFVEQPESASLFDPEKARRFAAFNSATAFADTIFDNLDRGPA